MYQLPSTPTIFSFAPSTPGVPSLNLRSITRDGEPWFVAADVCRGLGLKDTYMAMKAISPKHVTPNRIEGQRGVAVNCVSEAGLYRLLMRCNKAEARPFRRWPLQPERSAQGCWQ